MLKVKFTPLAQADTDRIYDHYAISRGAPLAADKVIDSIYTVIFDSLCEHPFLGRPVKSRQADMRLFLANSSHWIFYRSDEVQLIVYRVLAAKEATEFDYFA